MEAGSQPRRLRPLAIAGLLILLSSAPATAASHRTQNFLITAQSPQLAVAVGEAAERYRRDLATYWLGGPLPPWPTPCPVQVVAGDNLAAQGVTTYNPAPVRDFQMEVIGTPERILDSVLPHEVTHTVLATYFGRPLPRWADEGICTTVEHVSERNKHEAKLREFLRSRRGIAMNQLFLMREYPADVLPMYAQGYSVCRFLISQKGPRAFIEFLGGYMKRPSWTANVKEHYGYDSLKELQDYWLAWVADGGEDVAKFAKLEPALAPETALATTDNGMIAANPEAANTTLQPRGRAAGPEGNASAANATQLASSGLSLEAPATRAALASSPTPPGPTPSGPPTRGANVMVGSQVGEGALPGLVSPANSSPLPSSSSAAVESAATKLASTTGDGWYLRKRLEAASRQQGGGSLDPVTPMVPPSVRNSGPYQTAHPQAEQQMSRSATPIRWSQLPTEATGQFSR